MRRPRCERMTATNAVDAGVPELAGEQDDVKVCSGAYVHLEARDLAWVRELAGLLWRALRSPAGGHSLHHSWASGNLCWTSAAGTCRPGASGAWRVPRPWSRRALCSTSMA